MLNSFIPASRLVSRAQKLMSVEKIGPRSIKYSFLRSMLYTHGGPNLTTVVYQIVCLEADTGITRLSEYLQQVNRVQIGADWALVKQIY
jgi:hypothetical protein